MVTTPERLRAVLRAAPALDAEAAARAAEAQQAQVQQAAFQAAPGSGVRQAQAMAPIATQAVAQPALQAAQQAVQTQAALGQQAVQVAGQQAQTAQELTAIGQQQAQAEAARTAAAQAAAADRAQSKALTAAELAQAQRLQTAGLETDARVSFLDRKQREDLARLGRDVKAKLFDARLQFERDEAGRKFSNDRQMWDYTVASAKSDEQLKDRLQSMTQAYERKSKMTEIAFAKIDQALTQAYAKAEQERDQASKKRIIEMRQAMQKELDRRRHEAAQKGMILSSIAAGAVAGAPYGPWGVAAGAGAGLVTSVAATEGGA